MSTEKSLYPEGVDPRKSDETHNARGQWSPYSEKQRKAVAVLARRYEAEGMDLVDALSKAFEEVGDPEFINEVTHKESKVSNNKTIDH
jgi:hypothetical protein